MNSNCYLVYDENTKKCLAIDPGSENSEREICFIRDHKLELDYILVTHEHTDHNWGVNSLKEIYEEAMVVCTEECSKRVNKANRKYFLCYFDALDYVYQMVSPDITIRDDKDTIKWNDQTIDFILTPGHSFGSMCIKIDDMLFTGDTIMPYKPYFNGRDSNEDEWYISIKKMIGCIQPDITIYPGHGDSLSLEKWRNEYYARCIEKITVEINAQED